MNSYQLFRRSRLRLAIWYALVMSGILGLLGLGTTYALVQSKWNALEREIESIAGTLHDSLEPMLVSSRKPTKVLQKIFPDLCVSYQPCRPNSSLIQRHTLGISDQTTYYIRLFDHKGKLLAFSKNQPQRQVPHFNPKIWQTLTATMGDRYHQFTTILHSHHPSIPEIINHSHDDESWGYLQVGRTLSTFDAELQRLHWILILSFCSASGLIAISSWWLSGLAMQPIYLSYQRQQQFTADVAHELRSPLANLISTIEATQRLLPEQTEQIPILLQTIERQGHRLSQLITDLLLLARLERKDQFHQYQNCCLTDILNDLTEEFSESAIIKKINLINQVPRQDIYILGNESQLYRLFTNLISNAVQYTPQQGSIIIILEFQNHIATISIKDTGIGIPIEVKDHIFERFYRINSDRSRKTGGTGLGLAIAQAIAQKHGSKITVESRPKQGSCFSIQFKSWIS